jgi:two-component system sensor histidine kinase/response regulator
MNDNVNTNYLIMLVDDHPSILEVLKVVLEYEGFKTISCGQSTRALHMVAQYQPDLILLDIMMPTPDGWAILRNLRQARATVNLPVILMSAGAVYQIVVPPDLDLSNQNTKMLSKPFDNAVLINLLSSMLKTK